MSGQRRMILATPACDMPAASPTSRKEAPCSIASRMRRSLRSVHWRALSAALRTPERSGIVVGFRGLVARGEAGVDVDEAPEPLLRYPEPDLSVAPLALVLCHVLSVNKVSAPVNKVSI